MSSYFFALGGLPSIMRAWIACLLGLSAALFERRGSGLNALGCALIALLIYDPLFALHLGFQYSFAATAAILLLFAPCDQLLQRLFPKRTFAKASQMDGWNQHGYLLLALFRQAIALGLAVHLVTLPMMLFHFHRFPWMSLLYNLFFPALVSLSMGLLIVGLLASLLVPPLAIWIHQLNSAYTRFMLDFTYNLPPNLDIIWRISHFSIELLILLITSIFLFSFIFYKKSVYF
jgi:competence protein ComEC